MAEIKTMDYFLAPHSKEAVAHSRLRYATMPHLKTQVDSPSENWLDWDINNQSFDEFLVAHCASYHALDRYLSGEDIFILPLSSSELERVLWVFHRHSHSSQC
jgi:hypothetical protein